MANIRIAQQLSTGYNPDGTPGTVSTGLVGPAGPGPTDAQLAAAVSAYVTAHPLNTGAAGSTADLTSFGIGANGSSGAYVAIGTNHSTVSGYVLAAGSIANVDLHLVPKGSGRIFLDGPVASAGDLSFVAMTITDTLYIGAPSANSSGGSIVFNDTISSNITVATLNVGFNSFDSTTLGGFHLSNAWVGFGPFGGAGDPAGVSVTDPPGLAGNGGYNAIRASAFTVSSDRRLKSDIVELTGALETVRTTPAYSYVMKGERRRGLIADEAPADIVRTDEHGYQLIESYDLIGTLWAAVRELAEHVKGMK